MPGFVKTPKDEARWKRAKDAAGKSTKADTESYFKLANYIYHKMGKSEEDRKMAEIYKKELLNKSIFISASSGMAASETSVPNPAKVGSTAVKMPKAKKMADPLGKPSLFFKNEYEEFEHIKHPTLQKLRDFLQKNYR